MLREENKALRRENNELREKFNELEQQILELKKELGKQERKIEQLSPFTCAIAGCSNRTMVQFQEQNDTNE